jgi:AAA+ ATPase superfamily predicted ATPase
MKPPLNPFLISGYHPGFFCNRKEETRTVLDAVSNGRNVTLMSLRRMGKTGLIRHVFHQLSPDEITPVYLDIMHTTDFSSFVTEFAKAAINRVSLSTTKSPLQKIANLFSSIRPVFTVDPITGNPSVEIDIKQQKQGEKTLEDVFHLLEQHPKRVLVAFDEFQTITAYPDQRLEAKLRGFIQHLTNVSFIFSGSQKHLLSEKFTDVKRPFYQSTQLLTIDSISTKDYTHFIHGLFRKSGIPISSEELVFIMEWTYRHTFYVQYFCNRLYDLRKSDPQTPLGVVIEKIFQENDVVFNSYRTLLTRQQFEVLKAIAHTGWVPQPAAKQFLSVHGLTASGIQRVLPSLLQKEMVVKESEGYRVYDVFFARWLTEKF